MPWVDIVMTTLIGLGVRELWAMRKELGCMKTSLSWLGKVVEDHEGRIRAVEKNHDS